MGGGCQHRRRCHRPRCGRVELAFRVAGGWSWRIWGGGGARGTADPNEELFGNVAGEQRREARRGAGDADSSSQQPQAQRRCLPSALGATRTHLPATARLACAPAVTPFAPHPGVWSTPPVYVCCLATVRPPGFCVAWPRFVPPVCVAWPRFVPPVCLSPPVCVLRGHLHSPACASQSELIAPPMRRASTEAGPQRSPQPAIVTPVSRAASAAVGPSPGTRDRSRYGP